MGKKKTEAGSGKFRLVTFQELPLKLQGRASGSAWAALETLVVAGHIEKRHLPFVEDHKYVLDEAGAIRGVALWEVLNDAGDVIGWSNPRDIRLWQEMKVEAPAEEKKAEEPDFAQAGVQAGAMPLGFLWVPIDELSEWKEQPRTHFDEKKIEQLSGLMRVRGFDDAFPILVRKTEAGFEIADGHRRWRSAKRASLTMVPVLVRELSDEQMLEIALISGIQHESLSPMEEALGYRRMLRSGQHSIESIASAIGVEADTVRRKLVLCKVEGTEVAEALEDGRITFSHALRIARHPSREARAQLLQLVLNPSYGPGPMPVKELERQLALNWVQDLRGCGWSMDDAGLVPVQVDADGDRIHGGACNDCPFNSLIAHPAEGGKVKSSAAMCMNVPCFRAKEIAKHTRWMAEEGAKGNAALSAEENAAVWNPDGVTLAYSSPYVLADATPSPGEVGAKADAELPSWGKLVEGAEVPVVLAVDGKGKVRTLIKKDVAIEAVKLADEARPAAKKMLAEPKKAKKPEAAEDAAEKERAAAEAREARIDEAVRRAIVTAARLPLPKLSIDWLTLVVSAVVARTPDYDLQGICESRAWTGEMEAREIVLEQVANLPAHELPSLLTDLLLDAGDDFSDDWAAALGVDLKKVEKDAEKALKAEEKAEEKKAEGEKGLSWRGGFATEVSEFRWSEDGTCKDPNCAEVKDLGQKGPMVMVARCELGWVYGFRFGRAVEKPNRNGAKYSSAELATVSALTALKLEAERNGATDEQLAQLADLIAAEQKGAK
jgi:ParB/RepB/Spo0J family partition protein